VRRAAAALALAAACVAGAPAAALAQVGPPLPTLVMAELPALKRLGEGRLRVLGIHVSDSSLWAPGIFGFDKPFALVVPDGNWRQGAKVRGRMPGIKELPCAVLPPGPVTTYRLRHETKDGGLATLEAIARAYRILEGPERGPLVEEALLRVFRVMKMAECLGEASLLLNALRASRRKIAIFLTAVLTIVLVEGTLVYVLEYEANPEFRNIPQAMYWAIVRAYA